MVLLSQQLLQGDPISHRRWCRAESFKGS